MIIFTDTNSPKTEFSKTEFPQNEECLDVLLHRGHYEKNIMCNNIAYRSSEDALSITTDYV